jgi:MATE family multidrug resistance protein
MSFEFFYIYYKKLYVNTWNGWSTDCLYEWRIYLKLAVPGLFGLLIEWSNFEIGTLLAGNSNQQIQSISI